VWFVEKGVRVNEQEGLECLSDDLTNRTSRRETPVLYRKRELRLFGNSALIAGFILAAVFFWLFVSRLTPFSRFSEIGGWAISHGFWPWWFALCGLNLMLFRILYGNLKMNRFGEYVEIGTPIQITRSCQDRWRVPLSWVFVATSWLFLVCVVQLPWLVLSMYLSAFSVR